MLVNRTMGRVRLRTSTKQRSMALVVRPRIDRFDCGRQARASKDKGKGNGNDYDDGEGRGATREGEKNEGFFAALQNDSLRLQLRQQQHPTARQQPTAKTRA